MTRTRRAAASTLSASVLFGTQGTASALLAPTAPPAVVGTLRIITAAVVLIAVMPLFGGSWRLLPAVWRRPGIILAAVCVGLFQPLFFAGTGLAGVALGSLVSMGTGPLFAGLLGRVFLGHPLTRTWAAATAIAVAGLVLRSSGHMGGAALEGLLLAVLAGLVSGGYTVAAKHELERGVTTTELPAASFSIGGLILVPILLTQPVDWAGTQAGMGLVLYLGVVTMALANILHTRGIDGLPPGPVATLLLADPTTASFLGVVVLGETIGPIAIAGLILVLAGLLLQTRAVAEADPVVLEVSPTT